MIEKTKKNDKPFKEKAGISWYFYHISILFN
jgi:hypothetical protein